VIHPLSGGPALADRCAVTLVIVTYTLSKADAHTGGSLRLVVTVPDVVGLVVPVPDMGGRVELLVPLPQPGKKATAVIAPNIIASDTFEREQDFGFIDQPPDIRP
jgi:hypothetical protein